jgi:hypothetical protein
MVFRGLGFIVLGRLTKGIRSANISQTQKNIHIRKTCKSSITSTKREFHITSCLGRYHDCPNTNPEHSTGFSTPRKHFDRKM